MEQDVDGGPVSVLSRLQKETAVQTGPSHLKCIPKGATCPDLTERSPAVPEGIPAGDAPVAAGTITRGSCGTLHLAIHGREYRITPEDGSLLAVLGRKIPVYPEPGDGPGLVPPAGFACPGGSGCIVRFRIGGNSCCVPRDRFLALCLGRIVTLPLTGMMTDRETWEPGGGI